MKKNKIANAIRLEVMISDEEINNSPSTSSRRYPEEDLQVSPWPTTSNRRSSLDKANSWLFLSGLNIDDDDDDDDANSSSSSSEEEVDDLLEFDDDVLKPLPVITITGSSTTTRRSTDRPPLTKKAHDDRRAAFLRDNSWLGVTTDLVVVVDGKRPIPNARRQIHASMAA